MLIKIGRIGMKILDYREVKAEPVTDEGANGTTIRWLISQKENAPNFAMRLFEIEPGGNTPLHQHPWEHELFVLEGEGAVWSDGKEVAVKPGTAVFVPPNERHSFKNTGKETLKFLCMIPIEKK